MDKMTLREVIALIYPGIEDDEGRDYMFCSGIMRAMRLAGFKESVSYSSISVALQNANFYHNEKTERFEPRTDWEEEEKIDHYVNLASEGLVIPRTSIYLGHPEKRFKLVDREPLQGGGTWESYRVRLDDVIVEKSKG